MKLEEAIVYLLASSGHGMRTEQIAREINDSRLFTRIDKATVDGKMVYAVVMSLSDAPVIEDGHLLIEEAFGGIGDSY